MSNTTEQCINCNRTETEIPLVAMRYAGKDDWICSQCLPILIHKPQQLANKLPGTDNLIPVESAHRVEWGKATPCP